MEKAPGHTLSSVSNTAATVTGTFSPRQHFSEPRLAVQPFLLIPHCYF